MMPLATWSGYGEATRRPDEQSQPILDSLSRYQLVMAKVVSNELHTRRAIAGGAWEFVTTEWTY